MASALHAAADDLRKMEARSIVLDEKSDVSDDYALLVTDDPGTAEAFGLEPQEIWEYEIGEVGDPEDGVGASP